MWTTVSYILEQPLRYVNMSISTGHGEETGGQVVLYTGSVESEGGGAGEAGQAEAIRGYKCSVTLSFIVVSSNRAKSRFGNNFLSANQFGNVHIEMIWSKFYILEPIINVGKK